MKKTGIIFYLLLFSITCIGQDTIAKKEAKKHSIFIKVGGHYKCFWGNRFIEPTEHAVYETFSTYEFENFTKIPTYGFQGGFLFSCKKNKNRQLLLGLNYSLRKDVYEGDYDKVVKFYAVGGSSYNDIRNVIKYSYSYNYLELPVLMKFTKNKISFYAGFHLPILSFKKATYTYLVSSATYPFFSSTAPTSQKTIEGFEIPLAIFPTFQVSYNLRMKKMKNISVNPFLGIDIGTKKSIFIQAGLILPLKT